MWLRLLLLTSALTLAACHSAAPPANAGVTRDQAEELNQAAAELDARVSQSNPAEQPH